VYAPIIETQYPSILEKIKKEKMLNVVLLNSPSTFYIGTDGEQGFEYDLLKAYADYLGVGLNITVAHTTKEAIELSKNPDIHITSAALAKTLLREDNFNFGPTYLEVQQQVICYRGMLNTKNFPNDVEGLAGLRIMIGEDTSYSETVQALQNEGFDLNVTLTSEYSTEELLQKVSQNEIDCTIADSNIYSINLRYFPEIAQAFTISGREQLAWVLAPNSKGLKASMYEWLNGFNQSGAMAALKDHHSG
jgi:membrane-bound lytic murein transglycosylase F